MKGYCVSLARALLCSVQYTESHSQFTRNLAASSGLERCPSMLRTLRHLACSRVSTFSVRTARRGTGGPFPLRRSWRVFAAGFHGTSCTSPVRGTKQQRCQGDAC